MKNIELETVEVTPTQPVEPEKLWISKQKVIDRLNTVQVWVEVTPAVCQVCGTDLCEVNKLPKWHKLPFEEQTKLKAVLKKHVEELHGAGSMKIVKTSERPIGYLHERVVTHQNRDKVLDPFTEE